MNNKSQGDIGFTHRKEILWSELNEIKQYNFTSEELKEHVVEPLYRRNVWDFYYDFNYSLIKLLHYYIINI